MPKIRQSFIGFFFCALIPFLTFSQIVEFKGQVEANSDLEGIHVLNITSKYYSITDENGEFHIEGKLNDTLVISSVQYKIVSLIISDEDIWNSYLQIELEDYVNVLNEVFIGNTLSGNLVDDISSVKGKPDINFYDVGIPGYTGKPKTKRERQLFEADHGKFFYYYGIGFSINVNKILNRVTGRTKMLKNRVRLEKRDELMYRLKAKFSKSLFNAISLSPEEQIEFFYFCSEHEDFIKKASNPSDLFVYAYLQELLSIYSENGAIRD